MEKLKEVAGPWNICHKWPSSKLHLEIIKTNILSKIHDDHFKNVTSRVLTRFSFDLAWWPSVWLQVTQFELDLIIIKTNILSNIHDDYLKNVTSVECYKGFPLIWPGDLVFDPKWPSFKHDLEIIKTNILSEFHDDSFKNVTASVKKVFLWFGLVT